MAASCLAKDAFAIVLISGHLLNTFNLMTGEKL